MSGSTRQRRSGRAIVVGGSMAGLLCARVLSDHFEEVLLLDRDELPDSPKFRAGVPQSKHAHALLAGGLRLMAEFFPDLPRALRDAGAVTVSWPREALWLSPMGWGQRFEKGLDILSLSRELLEHSIRIRVRALPNLTVMDGVEVVGLSHQGDTLTGVELGGRTRPEHPKHLAGAFVVDATGRASHLPKMLASLGFPAPQETTVNSHLGYASQLYEPGPEERGWKLLFLQAAPPDSLRGGAILPVEGGKWMVTLAGAGGDYPPTEQAAFLRWAEGVRTPLLAQEIAKARPVGPIAGHRGTENRVRHYELLKRFPEHLAVTGDAACAFNPVYGQGMTVAAQGAKVMDQTLKGWRADSLRGFGRAFQTALAKNNAVAWMMATQEDRRFPTTEGKPPTRVDRLMHRYLDRLLRVSSRDPDVAMRMLNIMHMLVPPSHLFHPSLLWAAAAGGFPEPLRDPPLQPPRAQMAL